LPTPPFALATAKTRAIQSLYHDATIKGIPQQKI